MYITIINIILKEIHGKATFKCFHMPLPIPLSFQVFLVKHMSSERGLGTWTDHRRVNLHNHLAVLFCLWSTLGNSQLRCKAFLHLEQERSLHIPLVLCIIFNIRVFQKIKWNYRYSQAGQFRSILLNSYMLSKTRTCSYNKQEAKVKALDKIREW